MSLGLTLRQKKSLTERKREDIPSARWSVAEDNTICPAAMIGHDFDTDIMLDKWSPAERRIRIRIFFLKG